MLVHLKFCSAFIIIHEQVTSSSANAETALQSGLVLTESGRLELGDNILRTLQVYLQPL